MSQAASHSTTLPMAVTAPSDVSTFTFALTPLRSIIIDGEPWFVGNDVARILQLADGRQALDKLDDDERGGCSIPTPSGPQEMRVVSEGGLYTLILRCRGATTPGTLPHRFRKWLTSEVLPEIRRTGSYGAPAPQPDILTLLRDPRTALELIGHYATENLALQAQVEAKGQALTVANQRVAEQRPTVEAYHRLADAEGTYCVTDAAKAVGVKPSALFAYLRTHKWIYERGAPRTSGKTREVASQDRLDDRTLVHKTHVEVDEGGEDRVYTQIRVTAKGVAKLSILLQARLPGL